MTGEDGTDQNKDDKSGKSFAELIGKIKDIPRGPTQTKNPPPKPERLRQTTADSTTSGFHFPDPSEPRLGASRGVSKAALLALRRGDPEPEERIDLHGLRREGTERLIAGRLASARARGLRCVIVIHGRGHGSKDSEAVLRNAVPEWLSRSPCAAQTRAFAPAPPRLGGEGAMLVLLREPK